MTRINQRVYDLDDVEIILPSGIAINIEEITYSDGQDVDPRYGKGYAPRGWGRKNYEASGSITLDLEEAELLRVALGGRVYGKAFNIVVSYAQDGKYVVVDNLKDCVITKTDNSLKQGESNVGQKKFEFKILKPIEWNSVPAIQ